MLASVAHMPSLNKILSNAPRYHSPLLPQTSSETTRNNLVDATVKDNTLRNLSAPPDDARDVHDWKLPQLAPTAASGWQIGSA
jgi:hypothetical protein